MPRSASEMSGKLSLCIRTDKIQETRSHLLTQIPSLTQQMWAAAKIPLWSIGAASSFSLSLWYLSVFVT